MVICLERGADSHIAQLMPLPLTVSCFSKIQIGFTFLVPDHPVVPGKRSLNGCVCVCVSGLVGWLGSRVVSMLDSGAEGPRFKSQPQRCWVKVTCRASVHQAAKVVAALLTVARVTACLAERQTKHPNSAFLSPATLPHHFHTHLLLPLPLISQSSPLPHNPKSTRSCPAVQTSSLTQIRSPPGLL